MPCGNSSALVDWLQALFSAALRQVLRLCRSAPAQSLRGSAALRLGPSVVLYGSGPEALAPCRPGSSPGVREATK